MANSRNPDDIWKKPDKAYQYALERLSRRADPSRVAHELAKRGVSEEDAIDAVEDARSTVNASRRAEGLRTLLLGALLAVAGGSITWITYRRAEANPEGGRFTIWWGAIGFGVLLFARGLDQFLRPAIRPQLGSAPYRRRSSSAPSGGVGAGPSGKGRPPPADPPRPN